LQGEVVPASEKDPDGWSAADKFTVVLETEVDWFFWTGPIVSL
jgi:hypothetical protein